MPASLPLLDLTKMDLTSEMAYLPCLRSTCQDGRLVVRVTVGISSMCLVFDPSATVRDLLQGLSAKAQDSAANWRLTTGQVDNPVNSAHILHLDQLLSDIVSESRYIRFAAPSSGDVSPRSPRKGLTNTCGQSAAAPKTSAAAITPMAGAPAEGAPVSIASSSAAGTEEGTAESVWDTADTEDAIKQSSEQVLARCLEAEAADGWESTKPPKGADGFEVSVLTRSKTVFVIKVECTMNASQDAILGLLRQGQGGPKNASAQILQEVSSSASFMKIDVSVPIVKNRDFVCCQYIKQSDGEPTAVVVRTSVPESHATPLYAPNPKCIRGRMILQCTFVTPLEGDSSMSRIKWISCVDPRGKIGGAKKISATEGAKSMMALHKAAAESEGRKPILP